MTDDGIIYLDEVDSTNSYCMRSYEDLSIGTIVVADSQTAGRGRLGRVWHSPPGCNLYASIILKPPFWRLDPALLPHIASLAVYNMVCDFGVENAWIKWPNDVYAGGRKLAGVLTESRIVNGAVQAVVTGIGINLNMPAAALAELDKPATSIAIEAGRDIARDACVKALFGYFETYCSTCQAHGFEQIYPAWREVSALVGRQVSIAGGDRTVVGQVRDLQNDGSILIEEADGRRSSVRSGDLSLTLL